MIKSTLFSWIPLAIVITAMSGLIYLTMQQNYRVSANDPQIQIAGDLSMQLAGGAEPELFMPEFKTDISKSLATFIIIYDENGKLLVSSATVRGDDPNVPAGVFTDTRDKGETRFTWETATGERSAVVVKYFHGKTNGFILAGRSLKEVEIRIDSLLHTVFLGWLVILVISLTLTFLSRTILKDND